MHEAVLFSELFPGSVVFRLTTDGKWIFCRWQWKQKPYQIKAASIEEAVLSAIQAVKALESHGLV